MHELIVALGDRHYRVTRPFGAWPTNTGKVSDVTVAPDGRVYVLLRHDPLVDPDDPRVIILAPDGAYLGGFGGAEIGRQHGPGRRGGGADLTRVLPGAGPQPTGSPAITRWRARSRAGGTPSNSAALSQCPRLRRRPVAASCSSYPIASRIGLGARP